MSPGVAVRGVGRTAGGRRTVDDVSFDAVPGTVTAVLGPNGAGKSTLIKLMTGILHGDGTTTFGGRLWRQLANPRREVGVHLGSDPFHVGFKVRDQLGLMANVAAVGPQRVSEVVDRLALGHVGNVRISRLSLGTRQRVGLACALLGDPPVVILDEPCSALDPREAERFHGWLAELGREGRTILVATHHIERIQSYATEVVVMDRGRAVAVGSVDTVAATAGVAPDLDAVYRACVA